MIGTVLFVLLSHSFLRGFLWDPTDPLYIVLHFVKEYILLFLVIILFGGWALITYYFMGRPLHYLDEVIAAAEKLVRPTEEQIILSDALKSIQDELNRVRETALLNANLTKEAEQRKNDLVVYLAHDLKTPLASTISYLNLLQDEKQISEELREKYISISLAKSQRLEELVNEFLEIARYSLSNITLQYKEINLTRLLEQLVYEFQPILDRKGLTCRLAAADDILLKCDADKMQRVFDNLLRNAVLYSYDKTEITIEVEPDKDSLVLRFSNHGGTIPIERLERIFEQFYRLDTERSSGGTGLGLAIARQIVTLHKGTITAESENELTVFTVTLPVL